MSFIIQAIFSGFLALIILFIPGVYFSSTLNSEKNLNESSDTNKLQNNICNNKDRKSSVYNDSFIISKENPSLFGNFCKIIKEKVFEGQSELHKNET